MTNRSRALVALAATGVLAAALYPVAHEAWRESRLEQRQQQALNLGLAELEAGRIESAFLQLQVAVDLAPASAGAWLALARTWQAAGMHDDVELAATRALQHGAGSEARRLRLQSREALGRHTGARHDAQRLQELEPDDELAQRIAATQPAAATPPPPPVAAQQTLRFWPGTLATRVSEALDRIQARDWDGARGVAAQALQEHPGTMFGPWLAGVAAFAQGQWPEAEASLREALARSPRSSRAVTQLAGAWARQGGPQSAAVKLLELGESDPGFVVAFDIAATGFLEARLPAQAEAALRRAVERNPDSATAHRYLVRHLDQLERVQDARRACDDALGRLPAAAEVKLPCAAVSVRAGEPGRAITLYRELVADDAGNAAAAAGLVHLLLAQGDAAARSEARALADALARDAPADVAALDAVGWAWAETGAAKDAVLWLQAAAQRAGEDPVIRYHLGAACARAGDRACARRELSAALVSPATFRERPDAQRLLNGLAAR